MECGMRIEEGSCPAAYATNQTMRHTFSFASINVSFHFIPFTIDDCSESPNALLISEAGRHMILWGHFSCFNPGSVLHISKLEAIKTLHFLTETTVMYFWDRRLVLLKDEKQTNAILSV